ncbi:hypothetical protein [Aestuariivirga sp.]|uniref:hypothetical protein n=1 Tax=Aestuariivirga sp. TaxID=2650926 RepID=UPI0039E5C44B
MSRNEIRLDQIQQRLAGSGRPRQTQYDEYGYPIPERPQQDFPDSSDSGTTINAAFVATIIAASITAGMGTFYFMDNGLPSFNLSLGGLGSSNAEVASGSVLDPVCGKNWQADVPNTDQMYCYLTRQVYRLCDKDEHTALLATIKRYDKDYKVWHRQFMGATFKSIGKIQTQGMQLGLEAAKLDHMKDGDKGQDEQFKKVLDISGDIMRPTNDILAQRVNKIPEYELENAAYTLVKGGYIEARDFKGSKPDFIATALKRAGKVKTACPNREG